jgi:malonate-semialdehyde dehydrogenase (acetylating)/methylmalonate-semialdehyde dehydrogenase
MRSKSRDGQLFNPGTGAELARVPFARKEEVDAAVSLSQNALDKWKQVPLTERVQCLFVFEEHFEELA